MRFRQTTLALVVALAMIAAACADDTDAPDDPDPGEVDDDAADDTDDTDTDAAAGGDLIIGTTDAPTGLDPATVYDTNSSQALFNIGETLVGFPPGETDVAPFLAAELPDISDDGLTYTFTLRDDVVFSNGKEMTSEDVRFSLERAINMEHPQGAGFLLAGIDEIETPDDHTVVITLSEPNITFLSRLAYTVGTVIPSDGHYAAPDGPVSETGEDPDDFRQEDFVGTGRYLVEDFREGESMTLVANPDYWGDPPANDRVLVQFYDTSSQLRLALEGGEIDIAFRDLAPDEAADLAQTDGIQVVEGEGAAIRYLVLNTTMEPFDDPDVRQAFAAAIDRERLIENVFQGFGEPLHSMIASGFAQYEPLFERYDDAEPSDFLDEPVSFTLWHETGDHYGPTEPSMAEEIRRMLDESGMFEVETNTSEWAQFTQEAWPGEDGSYPAFLLGWYPSYFDADYYIEPFYGSGGFLGFYADDEMDSLIAAQQQVTDPDSAERAEIFAEIQEKAVDDVPLIPLFEETPLVFARDGVTGLEETMDVMQIFRYWLLSPGE
jgi:peptide/nickel transport system substrate-binding protein